jgi:hypothetical protein
MNKNILLAGLFLLLNLCLHAQKDTNSQLKDTISQRIVLIGDAGELAPDGTHPVVDAVRKLIPLQKNTTIIFMGDNIYPNGLPVNEFSTFGKI